MFPEVEAASERWKEAKQVTREARAQLVDAVIEAREQGASLGELAGLLGISRERVRQMTGDPDDRIPFESVRDVWCPNCEAEPGERCEGTSAYAHMERHERRREIHIGTTELRDGETEALLARVAS